MKKMLMLLVAVFMLLMLPNGLASAEEMARFTDGKFGCMVTSETDHTVCITDFALDKTEKTLTIPETVMHNNNKYKVTSINYIADNKQYDTVTKIVVPATLIGKLIISDKSEVSRPENGELFDMIEPFPNLANITFEGATPPETISVLAYLNGSDIIYQVPSGAEKAYEVVCKPFRQYEITFYDRLDGDHNYNYYEIMPLIMSDTVNNPEPHIFSTEHGVYLVTGSASKGNGTAKLIKCKELIEKYDFKTPASGNFVYPEWDDYTIESLAEYNAAYKYIVTVMGKGALAEKKVTMLTIPDTITSMEEDSINTSELKYLFLSKNCTTLKNRTFNTGENADQMCVLYVPEGVKTIDANALQGIDVKMLVLPETFSSQKSNLSKHCKQIIYCQKTEKDTLSNGLTVDANTLSLAVSTTKKVNVQSVNANSTETIYYSCMDPGTAEISSTGLITPKHQGIAYIVAFSKISGQHQLLQLNVTDKTFSDGIYTYRINYSNKKEVTVISCNPKKSAQIIEIPSIVKYKGITYTVTQVCAGKSIIDKENSWNYTLEKGYPRTYDFDTPIISDENAKNCKVTKIILPSTITRVVSNFGKLKNLTKVVCKGSTAPSLIALTGDTFMKAVIYVPSNALKNYKKTNWRYEANGNVYYFNSWDKDSIIVLKTY